MADVLYQSIDNAVYNWPSLVAGEGCVEVMDELRSWISVINGNASNSGKQVTLSKDETDSTDPLYTGFILEAQEDVGKSLYMQTVTVSSSTMYVAMGSVYTDNGLNNGYGTISSSSPGYHVDSSVGWKSVLSSLSANFQISKSEVDGEEFFFLNWQQENSPSYADMWGIAKTSEGYWAVFGYDSTVVFGTSYGGSSPGTTDFYKISSSDLGSTSNPVGAWGGYGTANNGSVSDNPRMFMASPDVYNANTTTNFGAWMDMGISGILCGTAQGSRIAVLTTAP